MFPPKSQWLTVSFIISGLLSVGCVDPSPMSASRNLEAPLPPRVGEGTGEGAAANLAAAGASAARSEPVPPAPPAPSQPTWRAVAAAPSSPPSPQQGTQDSSAKLKELYQQAARRYAGIDSYIARLRRREQVNGKDQPEELIKFEFRKEPWSVYFKWLGDVGKGREVVYVKGQYGNMLHTLLAAGDMPLMPAGKRMALAPDNVFVKAASRHAITEAGIGTIIEQWGRALEAQEKGLKPFGTLTYQGLRKRPEFEKHLETVEQQIPPGVEGPLPRGGRRWVFFDPDNNLPVLLITHDEKGHEVEYYCYDRLQYPVKLDGADFNPDLLWRSGAK